ncbi:MAG: family 78 glycoside hydrolase catalytic domain, partial [Limisphaerales bacterium]
MKPNKLDSSRNTTLWQLLLSALPAAVVMFSGTAMADGLMPVALRCEYRVDPQGVDSLHPRLTWRVASAERGARQTAYRILVASNPEALAHDDGDLWDSGRIASDLTVNVVYNGARLDSREQCLWKVCVWDEHGRTKWSDMANWAMGLLQPADWRAHYISFRDTSPVWKDPDRLHLPPAHQYRKGFLVSKKIRRATLYATALGIYEFYLNGRRVGEALFAPGWTDYHKSAYYNAYDVTLLVHNGKNAMGAYVADGWYAGYLGFGLLVGVGTEKAGRDTYGKTPALMAQLEIEYTDGSREIIPTDESWKVSSHGPVREADFLMGETYDARRETHGWTKPGFDDSGWQQAIPASENGSVPAMFYQDQDPATSDGNPKLVGEQVDLGFHRPPRLEAFPGVPVKEVQEIRPIAITSPAKGVYIFNLGQNIAGVARLKVKGPRGAKVQLRYGEMLYPDGKLMTQNLRKARATDTYILRGDPHGEQWTPQFTSHGFQYVEVTGYPGHPGKGAITGIALQSDTPLTSGFECSDPMDNRLFKNIVWTQRNNSIDLPTDCPQRDERFGWMGDAQIYVHCATLNADMAAFYTKWLRQVMEAQQLDGVFPGYCPFPFQVGWDFGIAWSDAGVICPWTIWQAYDDTNIIGQCWPHMVRFMAWRKAASHDYLGIVHGNDWGDWLSLGKETPLDYLDTVYFAYTSRMMSQMAGAIGKESEAEEFADWFDRIKTAFDQKYLRPDGSLTVDTETAYALALYMDLIPDDLRDKAGAILAGKIRSGETAEDSGITTGFLGTRPLLPVLTSVGENDLAVKLIQSQKFPSWGYEVAQGATTIWEHWDSYTRQYGFGGKDGKQNGTMNSFDHYAFGAVGEWILNDLAGIQSGGPGYDKIIIHPRPPTPGGNRDHQPIFWVKAH